MKARIIETGEEITIIGISEEWGTAQYYGSDGIYRQRTFNDKEIEFLDTNPPINWEQRRYEIAKDVLAASFAQYVKSMSAKDFTDICLLWADSLIEELKRQTNEEDNV